MGNIKLFVIDLQCLKGHQYQSNKIVRLLEDAGLDFILITSVEEYYTDVERRRIHFLGIRNKIQDLQGLSLRFVLVYFYAELYFLARKLKPEKVLFLNYDTVSHFLLFWLFKRTQTFVINHNNIDGLKRKLHCMAFNLYKNHINHIVFSDSIVEYLNQNFSVDINNIIVIPHNLRTISNYRSSFLQYHEIVCPSGSNNDEFFRLLISKTEFSSFLVENNYSIYVKTKLLPSRLKNIVISDKFLSNDEYENLIFHSKVVIIPLNLDFEFRISGVMLDALSLGKKVFVSESPVTISYSKKYPHLVYLFHDEISFFNLMETHLLSLEDSSNKTIKDYHNFLRDHSDNSITAKLVEIFY